MSTAWESTAREVSLRLVRAELEAAYDWMWIGAPNVRVRNARSLARSLAGDLRVLRGAGVGLVPDDCDSMPLIGKVNRGLAKAEFNIRAHEEEMKALGLAHVRSRTLVHSLGGRLLFPLRGPSSVGVAGMALDGQKPLWRCHRAVPGVPVPSEMLFEAGLDEVDGQTALVVCADPAAALRFRSIGARRGDGWAPRSPVVAPPTRRLTPAQAARMVRYAVGGRVELFVDDDDPKRTTQFTAALEAVGLEVSDVMQAWTRAVEDMERAVAAMKAGRRPGRRPREHQLSDATGGAR